VTNLVLRFLGGFDVRLADQPLHGFRSVKNEALLAYLVLTADRSHTRAALAGLLWPDTAEDAARRNLRQALFQLRGVLGPVASVLVADQTSIHFEASGVWCDTVAFTTILRACERHQHISLSSCPACMTRYADAVALYQGDFLHGLFVDDSPPLEEWILLQREWFHARALAMLDVLCAWHEAQGDFTAAQRCAQRQLELDPLREEAHRCVMRTLALAGQRHAALAAYEACWRVLEKELGLPPAPETEALAAQIREGMFTAATLTGVRAGGALPQATHTVTSSRHNLPPPSTTFIGRTAELAQLRQWLLDPARRLITIVGPGGVGKTRLALAAAADIVGAFADGVWFVPLVGLDDFDALATTIGNVMGLSIQAIPDPWQQVIDFLAVREVLLILDNFEHLLVAAGNLHALLTQAPRLRVLVTSRARLDLRAEHLLSLGGMPLPTHAAGQSLAALQQAGGTQLFLERAYSVAPELIVDAQSADAIITICRLVEGLPLGIELAASWVESYTCEEIADAILTNLDFLATHQLDVPVRQRSMRAVFDYSWRLLGASEQRVLAQLSVFRGEFGRDAALAVAQAPLELITSLVRQSLLRVVRPGRFVLHELLRQFVEEQAAHLIATPDQSLESAPLESAPLESAPLESAPLESARRRHAEFYLDLLAGHAAQLRGNEPVRSVAIINADLDNVRAAWRWISEHAVAAITAPALEAMARFYELAGLHQEAAHFFAEATHTVNSARLRTLAQLEQARACVTLARYADANAAGYAALADARDRGDAEQCAAALLLLSAAANVMGDAVEAERLLAEALPLAQQVEEEALIADILAAQAPVHTYLGRDGRALLEAALTIYRRLGNRRREGLTLSDLAMVATRRHDWDACQYYGAAALEIARTLRDRRFESMTLNILAAAYAARGDLAESNRALQSAAHLARSVGYQIGEVNALNSLGLNYLEQQEFLTAREYFEQALEIARRTHYRRGIGALLANLGNLAMQVADYSRAETLCREALEIARSAEDNYFMVMRLDSLGDVLRWQGDYAGALACFLEAADRAAHIGNIGLEAHARTDIGLIAHLFGDDERSARDLHKGMLLARQVRDVWCECRAEAALAWCEFVASGDARALATLRIVADRAHAAQETSAEVYALTALGAALLASNDLVSAEAALRKALTLQRTLSATMMQLTPLAYLADLQRRQGELVAALCTVDELLLVLGERQIGGVDDPLVIYAICTQVLRATADPRADAIAKLGCRHLLAQGARHPHLPLSRRVHELLG